MQIRTKEDLFHLFTYHSPKGDQAKRYEEINQAAKNLAEVIFECCPNSPETTLAIRDVVRAKMQANMSIAVNEAE